MGQHISAPVETAVQKIEDHASEIRTQGYTVIRDVLDQPAIDLAQSALDEIFRRESQHALKQGGQNPNYSCSYMLLQKHPIFRSIPMHRKVLDLMRLLLGEDCVLSSLNGLSMTPGAEGQQLHRDSLGFAGHTATINVLHTLDHFTRENGCTRLVPHSQQIDPTVLGAADKSVFSSLEQDAVYIEAPVGSVIAYEGSLIHAGSKNHSDAPRRALHAFFTRSFIKPQWDVPLSLSPSVRRELTEEQKKLFGFYSRWRRYDYEIDQILSGVPIEAAPPGLRRGARQIAKSVLQRLRVWQ